MRILAQILLATALAASPAAADGPLAGVWTDGELTLTLAGEADAYTGTFTLDGRRFELAAAGADGALTGSFSSDGVRFVFDAQFDGETLVLETGGAVYELTRRASEPRNPLAPRSAPRTPAESRIEEGWTEAGSYRFRAPDGWRAEPDGTGSVALYPPGVEPGADQVDEVYVLTEIVGVESADDPALDSVIRKSMLGPAGPSAVYEAEPFAPGGGDATRHTWRLLQLGRRLDAYVKESGGRLVAAVATGLEDKVLARREAVRRIAELFEHVGPPVADEPQGAPESSSDVKVDPNAPPFEPGMTSDGQPPSETWRARLSGKLLTRMGSGLKRKMLLHPDGTLEYYGVATLPAAADGAGSGPGRQDYKRGWWRVLTHHDQTYLAVVPEGAPAEEYFPLVARGEETYFGAERVHVSDP